MVNIGYDKIAIGYTNNRKFIRSGRDHFSFLSSNSLIDCIRV